MSIWLQKSASIQPRTSLLKRGAERTSLRLPVDDNPQKQRSGAAGFPRCTPVQLRAPPSSRRSGRETRSQTRGNFYFFLRLVSVFEAYTQSFRQQLRIISKRLQVEKLILFPNITDKGISVLKGDFIR